LVGTVGEAIQNGIQVVWGFAVCEVVELNVQKYHMHLLVMLPPMNSISDLMGRVKSKTAMKVFRHLRKKLYWGNHFWAKGYCVDTIGLDAEMIRKYVRHQEKKEKQQEHLRLDE
jgi:putative transposase